MFLSFSFAWLTSFWREKKRNLISNLTTAMMMMAATAVTPVLEKPVSWCTYPTLVCCLSLFFSFFFSHPTNLTLPTGVYVVCWKMYLYKKKRWCADSFMAPRRKKKKRIKESSYCVCVWTFSLFISWQGEWLAQKEKEEEDGLVSLVYYIPANAPERLLPLLLLVRLALVILV